MIHGVKTAAFAERANLSGKLPALRIAKGKLQLRVRAARGMV
jgi:hypothetical protein